MQTETLPVREAKKDRINLRIQNYGVAAFTSKENEEEEDDMMICVQVVYLERGVLNLFED